jgi:hypothetical protein
MDPVACNYDAAATCPSNLLCDYGCYGCTQPEAFNYDPEATWDNGTCCTSHWATVVADAPVGVLFYNGTGTLTGGTPDHPFCLPDGCYHFYAYTLDPEATAENFQVVLEDGSILFSGNTADLDPVLPASIELGAVQGCTYAFACNYNPEATCDDGTCEYISCGGCTDATATNYDETATFDNGSCCWGDVGQVTADGWGYWSLATSGVAVTYGEGYGPSDACLYPGCLYFSASAAGNIGPDAQPVTFTLTSPDGEVLATLTTDEWGWGTVTLEYGEAISGCTESYACNYNPDATCGDGSCDYSCYGCTDPEASNYDPEATAESGYCCYSPYYTLEATQPIEWWVATLDNLTWGSASGESGYCDPGTCYQIQAWSLTGLPFDLNIYGPDGSLFYALTNNPNPHWSAQFSEDEIQGCTDPGACNYLPEATCSDPYLCDYSCLGCTDATAPNFNPAATVDDGTCCTASDWYALTASGELAFWAYQPTTGEWQYGHYPFQTGFCMASDCFVFQAFAFVPEPMGFSILGPSGDELASGTLVNGMTPPLAIGTPGEVAGCTDPSACNYDELATCDAGNCLWYCGGCLDPSALNYNGEAEFEDGSCFYALEAPNLGMNLVPNGDQFYVSATWSDLGSSHWVVPSDGAAMALPAGSGTQWMGPYPCGTEVTFQVHDPAAGMAVVMTSPTFTWACGAVAVENPEAPASSTLQASPNPASDQVQFAGITPGEAWELFNAQGQTLQRGVHPGGPLQFDVADWAPGIYVLRTATGWTRVVVQ